MYEQAAHLDLDDSKLPKASVHFRASWRIRINAFNELPFGHCATFLIKGE